MMMRAGDAPHLPASFLNLYASTIAHAYQLGQQSAQTMQAARGLAASTDLAALNTQIMSAMRHTLPRGAPRLPATAVPANSFSSKTLSDVQNAGEEVSFVRASSHASESESDSEAHNDGDAGYSDPSEDLFVLVQGMLGFADEFVQVCVSACIYVCVFGLHVCLCVAATGCGC
jgi:hypothetical protein